MSLTWDLTPIYKSIDNEEYKKDKKNYLKKIENLNLWTEKNFSDPKNKIEKLEYYITEKNELSKYNKLLLYLTLLSSTDTSDEKIIKEIDQIENIEIKMTSHEVNFTHFLKEIENIEETINASEILKQFDFYIQEAKKYSNHILSSSEENIINEKNWVFSF